ncbi:hypothetical protein ABZV92_19725 [Streptomyces rubiginosohelvolus]|uniref:hypothetical protein n=1 Tax=Streptomyces rubiginosohelvolus TaxID=67362 RepID=UPI0033BBA991
MPVTVETASTADLSQYISEVATADELDILTDLRGKRREILRAVRGSLVRTGVRVELTNMKPQYLNGLVGTVTRTSKNRKGEPLADVKVDAPPAALLAKARREGGQGDIVEGIPFAGLDPA